VFYNTVAVLCGSLLFLVALCQHCNKAIIIIIIIVVVVFAVICRKQLKLDNMQSEDVGTLFPQSNKTQLLQRCAMELLALTAGAAMVIVRTKRQQEAELAARERRRMKRRRRL